MTADVGHGGRITTCGPPHHLDLQIEPRGRFAAHLASPRGDRRSRSAAASAAVRRYSLRVVPVRAAAASITVRAAPESRTEVMGGGGVVV